MHRPTSGELYEQYDRLREIYESLQAGQIVQNLRKELMEIFGQERGETFAKQDTIVLQNKIQTDLRELSLELQSRNQTSGVNNGQVDKAPHIDDRLRANRLGEYMSYEDRLNYVLSRPENYAKINPSYLREEKNALGYRGKKRNKGAVVDRIKENFLINHFVLDPELVTQDMVKYLLDGKSIDTFIADPKLTELKKKFARPYTLEYQTPGELKNNRTSRITFFRQSPAIAVFRSADTHPIVENPTKHEQRKIQKDVNMYITNSSYDIITQQYQSIQHITKNKDFVQDLLQELQTLLNDRSFGPNEKLQISQAIDAIGGQINPHVLMTRLYNLSKIQDSSNKTIQQNLLLGALNKLQKRSIQLGKYLYYMIPQLKALEEIHEKNIENIKTLHSNLLIATEKPLVWPLAKDTRNKLDQFNKHDITELIIRELRQHDIQQKDHLMGMFYTMHKQIGELLQMQQGEERDMKTKITVYTHRLIMAAEQLKQDIQSGKINRPEIYVHTHFEVIRSDIYSICSGEQIQQYFGSLYGYMAKADEYIRNNKVDQAIKQLRMFKTIIE